MTAQVISTNSKFITLELKIPLGKAMLEGESLMQDALNEAGTLATGEFLKQFDTDGSPIKLGPVTMTIKGLVAKQYQTPYGVTEVARHVYQTSAGGKIFCPLDKEARIVVSSTPRFAKQTSHKFAEMASPQVAKDLEENHNRKVARSYLQNVADSIGTIALLKEESWEYSPPTINTSMRPLAEHHGFSRG